jgi:hypothetical protein
MDGLNSPSRDVRVDLAIDEVIARRPAGSPGDSTSRLTARSEPDAAGPGSDEYLILRLAELGEIDWPPDEVGDRVTAAVAASVPGPAVAAVGGRRHRSRARRRPARQSWLAAAGVAAAVALIAVTVQVAGGRHGPASDAAARQRARPAPPAAKTHHPTPAWLTAMTIVSRPGALAAVGAVEQDENFLTCVTPAVCYIVGSTDGGKFADVARSLDGGAKWASGEALPALPGSASFQWNAPLSCPRPQTCYSAFGPGLLETTDGFAHYRYVLVTLPPGTPSQLGTADDVSCPTTRHCVADVTLDDNSQVLIYSDDGGLSWASATAPGFADFAVGQLLCDRAGACVAALDGGDEQNPTVAALASTDGGRSWTMSGTYADPGSQQVTFSCGDARNCLISGSDGPNDLAWIHVTAGGRIVIRVRPVPSGWATPAIDAGSCATGSDCFVVTDGSYNDSYHGTMIEATRDDGLTWTAAPLYVPNQSETAVYLSCPVPAGCVAVAQNPLQPNSDTWAVLSDLRRAW